MITNCYYSTYNRTVVKNSDSLMRKHSARFTHKAIFMLPNAVFLCLKENDK